ncbi:tRNA 2-thiouridine(34) synthase MnmA [Candidatus Nomurabacteria bacterium]|nr:tRNA 2-thiouridine(34) synthase MnmA [Candidatus Nomurabacteria bacterium]
MSKKLVFVGLSGGVDSAVSATLLKKATPNNFEKLFGRPIPKGFRGFEVVGVFIKTWHPDFLECNEEEERQDAMRVAAFLDVPFLTFDLEGVYKKEVADYMIKEYKAGRTPNPDVMCNKEVKFGAFLKKAIAMGADFMATGHYARVDRGHSFFSALRPSLDYKGGTLGQLKKGTSAAHLSKGKDPAKDQSYFLWTLKKDQLEKILFPIGHLKKTEVRKLAKKFHLPVAEKKDSQGICFLGDIDLKEFLKHYIKEKKGEVILVPSEVEGGKKNYVIGYHHGVVFSTLGERHGFTITKKSPNDRPHYVVGKDIKKNILIVSQNSARTPLTETKINLENTNWINKKPMPNKIYTAQIRYHGKFLSCKVKAEGPESSRRIKIIFKKPVLVAPGQSVVVYDKDVCLGGGVVQ